MSLMIKAAGGSCKTEIKAPKKEAPVAGLGSQQVHSRSGPTL